MKKSADKYLPIGTVVLLTGGTKRMMVTGFCIRANNDKEKVWDYSGCLYPEGIVNSTQTLLFDHEQIQTIYHYGLVDEEEIRFKENLEKVMKAKEKEDKKETKPEAKKTQKSKSKTKRKTK